MALKSSDRTSAIPASSHRVKNGLHLQSKVQIQIGTLGGQLPPSEGHRIVDTPQTAWTPPLVMDWSFVCISRSESTWPYCQSQMLVPADPVQTSWSPPVCWGQLRPPSRRWPSRAEPNVEVEGPSSSVYFGLYGVEAALTIISCCYLTRQKLTTRARTFRPNRAQLFPATAGTLSTWALATYKSST